MSRVDTVDAKELYSIAQFAKLVPGFEKDHRKVRHLVNNAQRNGLAKAGAVVRLGGRVFINKRGFNTWLATLCEEQEQSA